jgi:integrase
MKNGFRVKPYKHSRLKFVVRGKVSGKWERRYFVTKAEANTFAQQQNTRLLNEGREGVEFPSWLRLSAQRAHEALSRHGKTIEDAVAFFVSHLEQAKRSAPLETAVTELIANRRQAGASQVYCYDLQLRLGRFVAEFAGRTTAEINTADIDSWLEALGVASVTRNTYRRDLRTFFRFCVTRGYTASNPAAESRRAKELSAPVGILTANQLARLLEASHPSVLPYLAIGAFAGLRAAEIERLDWKEIDLAAGLIEVTAKNSKTAKRRLVKILPNLKAWLQTVAKQDGSVIPRNLRWLLLESRKAAGLSAWPANALRHSYASHHIARFNDAAALALELGHTHTGLIFEHYRQIVKPDDAKRYWEIIPAPAISKVVSFNRA